MIAIQGCWELEIYLSLLVMVHVLRVTAKLLYVKNKWLSYTICFHLLFYYTISCNCDMVNGSMLRQLHTFPSHVYWGFSMHLYAFWTRYVTWVSMFFLVNATDILFHALAVKAPPWKFHALAVKAPPWKSGNWIQTNVLPPLSLFTQP